MRLATRLIGCAVAIVCAIGAQGAVSDASAQSITDKVGGWLFGKPSPPPPAAGANPSGPPAEIDCPSVNVRQGASTLAITAPGTEASPMTTRYQVSIGDTARECAALGGLMTMKVGVEGRVLLGPVGSPGHVDIPLRVAVVREGPNPKTVLSKFAKLAVEIAPGQTSVPFVHVEQDLSFPMPGNDFDSYVVYVGFDPESLGTKPERKARPKKAKPRQ